VVLTAVYCAIQLIHNISFSVFSVPGPYEFFVPHSLTMDSLRNQLIVADRENSRILGFDLLGKFLYQFKLPTNTYGVAYSPRHGNL